MSVRGEVVTITALGAHGDGLARDEAGRTHHIPLALPGEQWAIDEPAPARLITADPERAEPACAHFGICGGCSAQHMPAALYRQWKRAMVVDALRHRGLQPPVGELVAVPAATRRRTTLSAWRSGSRIEIGYHGRRSHERIAIHQCPVLEPGIVAHFSALRRLVEIVDPPGPETRLAVTMTRHGADIDIGLDGGAPDTLEPRVLAALAALARDHGFARLSLGGRPVVEIAPSEIAFTGKVVAIPPAVFLQASRPAEEAIVALVVAGIAKARAVADLFAGVGTLTLAVAARARVLAIDADYRATAALAEAARRNQGLKPFEVRSRDLFRDPLSPVELKAFDAVVLDPPRAGARAQVESLARSTVLRAVMVSCNPATMARDLRTLADGGFAIERVTPVDQFVWSSHIEAVAVLSRPSTRRPRS